MTPDEPRDDPRDTVAGADAQRRSRDALRDATFPGLTILCHPDASRIGDQAPLPGLDSNRTVKLSRLEPAFGPPRIGEGRVWQLGDDHLSREPLLLTPGKSRGGVAIARGSCRTAALVDGSPLGDERQLSRAELEQGIVLLLAGRVVLVLHLQCLSDSDGPRFGMVGEGRALVRLRREIQRVADLDVAILLLGETGTGKELVARAIHDAGTRRERPFVAINIGAVPPTLAASELFGAARGAFTGASRHRFGYFSRANGGTLFLDEIADMPSDVQVLLLRTLENREIQPVGAELPQQVDVRIVAATDSDLEAAVVQGRFRAPLLHRLNGYEIRTPSLRERPEDVGRLLVHFLRQEFASIGEPDRLAQPAADPPWLPADLVARLACFDWPGNVRQLRNVARQLVIHNRGAPRAEITPQLRRMLDDFDARGPASAPAATGFSPPHRAAAVHYRPPSQVTEDELLGALRANRWRLKPTATALGVSRTSLYALLDRCSSIRKASEIDRDEIARCLERQGGDLDAVVEELQVSKPGLQRRMKELGVD